MPSPITQQQTQKKSSSAPSPSGSKSGLYQPSTRLVDSDDEFGVADLLGSLSLARSSEREAAKPTVIHFRSVPYKGRQRITFIYNVPAKHDLRLINKALRRECACNGAVASHPEYGGCIKLQGDHRIACSKFFVDAGLCAERELKIHPL